MDDPPPSPIPEDTHPNPHAATVEDLDDDLDEHRDPEDEFIERFPMEYRAGFPIQRSPSVYEYHRQRLQAENKDMWSPFQNEGHWDMAKWLVNSGVSQNKINSFLKLPIVRPWLTCRLYYA